METVKSINEKIKILNQNCIIEKKKADKKINNKYEEEISAIKKESKLEREKHDILCLMNCIKRYIDKLETKGFKQEQYDSFVTALDTNLDNLKTHIHNCRESQR